MAACALVALDKHASSGSHQSPPARGRPAAQRGCTGIQALDYDFHTGLHYLVFEFSAAPDAAPRDRNTFLTILDGSGTVIAVIDPFDVAQPNRFVPPLLPEGDLPFVLDRPSASRDLRYSDDALFPVQVRSRAFPDRLNLTPIDPIIDINTWTTCQSTTWTPYGSVLDITYDDCGQPW